jgi:N,N-dimethylformamidase
MTTLIRGPEPARNLVGYCWPWTVRAGDCVNFMVSCERSDPYRADLVRIICADSFSREPRFKEMPLRSPFEGEHAGRFQRTHVGSYVEIPNRPPLDELRNFTVQAMVFPTFIPGGTRLRAGGGPNSWEAAHFEDQHLISRWSDDLGRGWALLIDPLGRPTFMVGEEGKVQRVSIDLPLMQDRWFLLAASVDLDRRRLHVGAQAVASSPGEVAAWPTWRHAQEPLKVPAVPHRGPLRFAACSDGLSNGSRLKPAHGFNGRLDRVRLCEGLLATEDVHALSSTGIPDALQRHVVGFWDFGKHIDGTEVRDLSGNDLHGETVNVPTRGVRGVEWDGSANDWKVAPDHYSAIHFHDDDLYDAEWEVDFTYTVPQELPSGIYAARLRQGDAEDYVPFFVAPPFGEARAPLALLLPTATYTAYTNITGLTTLKRKRQIADASGVPQIVEEDTHPCLLQNAADATFLLAHHRTLGKGIYANHTDGTLVSCASQRHPNMTIKPKGINWTLVADTYLVDWLTTKGFAFDVITDDLLHLEGADLLKRYSVVLTGNHPEYYTRRMLDAVEQYQRDGGRWMYLGGNGYYWVTSFHPQLPGVIEVRKDVYAGRCLPCEQRHAFDGESGGRWEHQGRSPARLVGVRYDFDSSYAMEGGAPYRRLPDSYLPRAAFIFEGVSSEWIGGFGAFGGGAAGQEVDALDAESGAPAHALHLARADTFETYGSLVAEHYRLNARTPIADLVFFETCNNGAVFAVGSMSWVGALAHQDFANDVSRITENVLRRFLDPKPFLLT